MENQTKCKQCEKLHDASKVKRSLGEFSAPYSLGYCSSQCYTAFTINSKNQDNLNFGDYALIEQKRHGVPNEIYLHKVIGRRKSNTYVDVPVQTHIGEVIHNEIVDVILCICCGVSEKTVWKYKATDVKPNDIFVI